MSLMKELLKLSTAFTDNNRNDDDDDDDKYNYNYNDTYNGR